MFPKIVQIEKTLETGSLKLERWRLVWYDIAIPKQAIILWLVFHHGLSISEKKIK
jgi:alpha-D-ribose 1-methylphosphonate 5-triphosphate synthase subunit PhnH